MELVATNGPLTGTALPLTDGMTIGPLGPCVRSEGCCRISASDRGFVLHATSRRMPIFVNGLSVTARRLEPSVDGLLDLALAYHLAGDVGGEVSACEHATTLEPESAPAWGRYAHALARTDRVTGCVAACDRALELEPDPEVGELAQRLREAVPRELRAA